MGRVYVIGTCDTKADELRYAKDLIARAGADAVLVDVGTRNPAVGSDVPAAKSEVPAAKSGVPAAKPDVPAAEIARHHPRGPEAVLGGSDRGAAVTAMAEALSRWLSSRDDIGAVLGLGGSGNTALVTAAMRALPVGVPKLMVSTVASGDVAPYVGPNDIAMMYSVTDIAGLNAISRKVIGNAAHAAAGMAKWTVPQAVTDKPGIGITMFGVTTDCVTELRRRLDSDYEAYVFHATGTGGQSMEKLAESGLVAGMIDVTTTEVADFLVGGVFPCTGDRFGAVARTKLPYVGSVGAVDMVNFGARETVPSRFAGRKLYVHNPQVTLMRTTPEESAAIGEWIAKRLNACNGDVRFVLPLGGVSAVDAPDMPFHDPAADEALFAAIRASFVETPRRRLIESPLHINDPAFAELLADEFREIAP